MTAHALITGSLATAPESKTSKNGKPYVSATVKAAQGEVMIWWRCIAFGDDATAALGRLKAGDGVSVQGSLKLEIYTPEGKEPRVSPSLMVHQVIALRQENVK